MTLTTAQIDQYRGAKVLGQSGDKIGKIKEFYLDDVTGRPEWALVDTGLFSSSSFVPIADAIPQDGALIVAFDTATVKDAPRMDADDHLDEAGERELYRYYGLAYDATPVGDDISGPETDDAMTLSEERLTTGTRRQEAGRVRLRKHVVTEQVTRNVPVAHEEARLEREPITDANRDRALDGPPLSEEEHEVTLHEEVPQVDKQVVPTERVRLGKERVTDQVQVSDDLAREEVTLERDRDSR